MVVTFIFIKILLVVVDICFSSRVDDTGDVFVWR